MAGLNLDDIFGDVAFTPDGDTVFLSEDRREEELLDSHEDQIRTNCRKPAGRGDGGDDGQFVEVERGGGLMTTQLYDPSKRSLAHGSAVPGLDQGPTVPYRTEPQKRHQLQYVVTTKKGKGGKGKKSDQQKSDRR